MVGEYSEYILIEQPAIELFKSLSYNYQNCYHETFGKSGTLGRETPSDVVLISRVKQSLIALSPSVSSEAINLAIEELTRDRSVLNPANANREIYKMLRKMLRDGVKVPIKKEDGSEEIETIKVIDFNNPDKNNSYCV